MCIFLTGHIYFFSDVLFNTDVDALYFTTDYTRSTNSLFVVMHLAFPKQLWNLFTSKDQKVATAIRNDSPHNGRSLTLGDLVAAGTPLSDVAPKLAEFQSKYHLAS